MVVWSAEQCVDILRRTDGRSKHALDRTIEHGHRVAVPSLQKSPELLARTQTNNASPIPESACSPCFSFFSRASTEGDPSEKTEVARPKSRRQKTVHQDINMTCHVRQNCAAACVQKPLKKSSYIPFMIGVFYCGNCFFSGRSLPLWKLL